MTTSKTSIFALLFAVPFALVSGDSDAKYCNSGGSKAPAGRYCKALMQFDCEPGCYCTGGGNFTWGVGDVPKGCKERWNKVTSELNSKGVYLCPSDYPDSPSGATSKSQCFTKSNSGAKVTYGTTVKCEAGKYLPAGETSCASCQSDSVCAGGTFDFSKSSSKGISKCTGGQVPNSKHTACETSKTTCESGKYLPANSVSCSSCPSRYYLCIGGSFPKSSGDQGIQRCSSGQIADYNTKTCVNESKPEPAPKPAEPTTVTCTKQQYLRANTSQCTACTTSYPHYCTGGTFTVNPPSDLGIVRCASDEVGDSEKQQCVKKAPDTIECGEGYAVLANTSTCTKCELKEFLCLGGTFKLNQPDNQGITDCHIFHHADYTTKKCEPDKLTCSAGQYLPAYTPGAGWTCQPCKSAHICPGGTYPLSDSDQGAQRCPEGMGPNETKTQCVYGSYICEPGTFLPAKGTKCITCPTTRNYCPGGTFTTTTHDQGVKICPDKTLANAKRTACVLNLSKDQMRYGLSSTPSDIEEQCWTRNTMDEYVRCMFGGKMVVPYNAGPIIKSEITNSQE